MAEPTESSVADSIQSVQTAFPDCAAGATETCPHSAKPVVVAKGPAVRPCVKQVTATVEGTVGVRDTKNTRAPKTFSSSSGKKSLAPKDNVILVCGCKDVRLAAVTTPPNTPVAWTVEANPAGGSTPAITPDPKDATKATLKTDVAGSFAVMATLGGCKIVWNVVFVWVKVDVQSASITVRDKFYGDHGSSANNFRFKSGDFSPGKYAWEATVKGQLIGGGKDQKLGVDKVKLRVLQNCWKDTVTGHYAGGGTAMEDPNGGLPTLDAEDKSPFIADNTDTFRLTNPDGVNWEVWTGDSPGSDLDRKHAHTSRNIESVSGCYFFRTAIASTSDDAPGAIVVHAFTEWIADFRGIADAKSGDYVAKGTKTTLKEPFALFPQNPGEDAGAAQMETFPPRFGDTVLGTPVRWNP